MSVINIIEEDILKVEEKFGVSFDEKSKEFIKCLESKDIQACPGAGKTTSLVAKLEILSNCMPFVDNTGILVLTHTNIAVDEIKKKLGANAQKILGYPNHVGTFQSFVNKYLAIPMYIKLLHKKPERIDSDIFNEKLLYKLKKYYLDNFILMSAEANNYSNIESFLKALVVETDKIVLPQVGGRKKTIVNKGKPSYQNIKRAVENHNIIKEVMVDGYLTYEHCYELAVKYLQEHPQIIEIFQKRFKYIFVDEAQDTDDRQFHIINTLFTDSIVQRIGDNNQAIFNFSGQNGDGWQIEDDYIEIKNTKRLSKPISDQVIKVALVPQELNGNTTVTIQPTIIIFDNIEDVIPKFSELIIEHGLHTNDNKCLKVVGAVAKANDNGHTLINYFPDYSSTSYSSLVSNSILEKLIYLDVANMQPNEYRSIILDIVNEYLKSKNIKNNNKNFTKISLFSFLKENNEQNYEVFKLDLFHITQKLASKECVREDLEILLQKYLDLFSETLDKDLLDVIIEKYKIDVEKKSKQNIYKYEDGDINLEIEISTIHKVKGETHTATLIVETFKNGYDLFHLLKLLQGKKFAGANKDKKKLLYVAMSRSTHFLCLAIHREQKNGKLITSADIIALESSGFRVIS